MSKRSVSRSRAFSPVISVVILSAVVLAVGGAIWAFSQGTMTITAEDYAENMMNVTDAICERFIIEHVADNGSHIFVWVYNYGDVDIVIDVYIDIDGGSSNSILNVGVDSQGLVEVERALSFTSWDEVAVKAVSRRGNNAYYRYIVS